MASLGNDLGRIRIERNITLDDIQEATKIPKRILRAIENDTIFTDLDESSTYIRSYIRSYAKALSIDEKKILKALDKVEKNAYSGSLQELLDDPDQTFEFPGAKDESDKDKPASESEDEVADDEEVAPSNAESQPEEPEKSPIPDAIDKPDVRSVNWADLGREFKPMRSTKSKVWIGVLIFVLIMAGGAIYYFYPSETNSLMGNENTTASQKPSEPANTDSLELNIVPRAEEDTVANTETDNLENRSLESLPDTLSLVLYAAYGKLEPVRVYTDIMDNINPYWIDEGEAIKFNFVNEIRIRGDYNNIALLMNGHVVQNFREQFYNPEERLVEINRSYFKKDSKWLQPAPDSLAIDAPPPSVIRKRPTFN